MSTDPLDQPEEPGYGLVYPFICVTSKGGPYDDAAFVAGATVGSIDMALEIAKRVGADRYPATVPTALVPQLELAGMARGFPVLIAEEVAETDEYPAMPEWTFVTFLTEADIDD
jgi:hypothetical protein